MTLLLQVIALLLLFCQIIAATKTTCECPPSTTQQETITSTSTTSSTVTCVFPHSPFTIQNNMMVELHLTANLYIPNTTSINSTQTRIQHLFSEVHLQTIPTMERENDGTSIVMLAMAPGISTVEALTSAVDILSETCGPQLNQIPNDESETYSVVVTDHFVYVGAHGMNGFHIALGALENVMSTSHITNTLNIIPSIIIPYDTPLYSWRGFHLDVARHFFEIDTLVDLTKKLVKLKLNVLHLHLTDDQGWRLPIFSKWPLLTTIGSQRRNNKNGNYYGGHYSFQDINTLVELCQELNILIVPEIDVPGHAGAILAAYPSMGCNRYGGQGSIDLVPTKWGQLDYALCLRTKYDKVLSFSLDVLQFVEMLFPNSKYIHVGGDEIPSQSVTDASLVSFFRKIAEVLKRKNKKIIVWDEVLSLFQGEQLPNNMVIQAWQSTAKVREALLTMIDNGQHIPVIASPQEYVYLNKLATSYETVLQFDPMPCSIKENVRQQIRQEHRLLGGSLCLWTEYVENTTSLYKHAFPRTYAFANAMWSSQKHKKKTKKNDACIFTSMKTYLGAGSSHAVQNVEDNNIDTMFWSEGAPSRGDHITIRYASPEPTACGVKIVTGGKRNQDRCRKCSIVMNGNHLSNLSNQDGSLHLLFEKSMVIQEFKLLINAGGTRDWLMVPEMHLIPCDGDEEGENKIEL